MALSITRSIPLHRFERTQFALMSRSDRSVLLSAQNAKKKSRATKKTEERRRSDFIEQSDGKVEMFERAQLATKKNSTVNRDNDDGKSSSSSSSDNKKNNGGSFEEKLNRVREEGALRRKSMPNYVMDDDVKKNGTVVGMSPVSPMQATFGGDNNERGNNNGDDDSEESLFKSPIVRIGSLLAAIALAIVFLPTDLTFNAIGSKQVQEKYRKEALSDIEKQAKALKEVLANTPDDPVLIKQQVKNFLALDDYLSALPLMEKLVSIEDTEENVMAIAEVWNADGQPDRALVALKSYADKHLADKTGPPSATFLKALTDSLAKNNRQGIALAYIDAFVSKNAKDIDEVDRELLKARVYSSWKGKGKEAEQAFADVVLKHPEDFRGYLAKGVFAREIGRPDEAKELFNQALALAPEGDTKFVVKDVISRAKAQKSGSVKL